jgi:hypothetical protein
MLHGELHPQHARPRIHFQDFVDDAGHRIGATKDVDHVDRLRKIGELRIDLLAAHLLAGVAGIDREDPVASLEQIFESEIARPVLLGRKADHGDRLHRIEDSADVAVGIGRMVHVNLHNHDCVKSKAGLCRNLAACVVRIRIGRGIRSIAMCAYSLRKLTARLTGHEAEDPRPTMSAFEQLEQELALHALPEAPAPRLVAEAPERESAAA